VAVVPLFRVGEQLCLDREGKRRARLGGELSREDAVTIFQRAVRLSRFPIPQELSRENPPSAWRRTGLLRGLLPLEVGRVFGTHGNRFRVELDPELGVVYTMV
jgi:CRISPR-associated endonuclease/helicase Cas3